LAKTLAEALDGVRQERSDATPAQTVANVQTLLHQATAHLVGGAAVMAAPVVIPARGKPQRVVYHGNSGAVLPGSPVIRSEGDPPSPDQEANEAYDGAGYTYDLFYKVFQRHSLDDQGLALVSTVHHRRSFDNAFWNGTQMAYGDADGRLFHPFTRSQTVIGHELTHGVVEFCGGLDYNDQSGALNEHIADVFGCLSHQYRNGQTAEQADWLVGAELLNGLRGTALRSMKAPGTAYDDPVFGADPQPYHMRQYVHTHTDNGGVHLNSGIPNHAFYLLAILCGGNAWVKPGRIWYETLKSFKNPTGTFQQWAEATVRTATKVFGVASMEERHTIHAWRLVGIL
jgi:Zn-dependent metalloprotease